MRISSIQSDILFILFLVEMKGNVNPMPSMKILELINKNRAALVADTNFRTSCHKLNEYKMIDKYRSSSLKLAWRLSDEGRAKAEKIYTKRVRA